LSFDGLGSATGAKGVEVLVDGREAADEEEVEEDEEYEDEEKDEFTFELNSQARMRKACIPFDEERRRNMSRRMRRRTVGGSITSVL